MTRSLITLFSTIILFWTVLIVVLATLNYNQFYNNSLMIVKSSAEDAYNKDLVYRRWATMHGGVYAPITDYTPPNPFLKNIPERDIETPSGKKLTLINPAYMTRQVHELGVHQFGLLGHITSLTPIRPENAADPWEEQALKAFEKGVPEMASLAFINGTEYFRFMQPLVTEKGCLKCHAHQGYKIGDIRGGISVSVPWNPVRSQLKAHLLFIFLTYSGIWLLGFSGIGFIIWNIQQDLKRRISFENSLGESEQKYRSLFDNMNQGMALHQIILDKEGTAVDYKFLDANQSFEELTQLKRKDIIGKTVLEVLPGTENFWIEKYGQVVKTGSPLHYENYSGDHKKYFEVIAYRVQTDRFAVIISDVTGRRKNEEEILQKNKELQKLNATKDKFFSIIAHDLKSPFNSIMGFTELLAEQVGKKDYSGVEKYSEIILQSSQRAVDLLINLMDWSRSQTGRIKFDPEYFELVECINDVTSLFNEIAGQKGVIIKKELPPNAPVFADPDMIKVVLRNLISNAIKFTKSSGEIIVSIQEKEKQTTVLVRDTGIGISKNRLEKIFRIDEAISTSGTNNEQGTGLGLILCKEFIEKHGGEISVESEIGKGSVFLFTIPNREF